MATKRMKRSKKHKQKMRRRKYYRQGPYDEPTGAPGEPETTYSPEESGNWRQRQKKRVKEFATKQYEDVAPYGTKTGAFVKENVGGMAREAARPVKEVKGAVAGTISTGRQVYGILTNPVKSTVGTFLSKEQQKNQAYIEQKQRIADKKAKSYKERQEEKADKKLKNLKTYGGTGAGNWFRRNVTTRGSTKKQSLSDIRKETGRIKQIAEGEGIHIRNTKFRDKFLLRKTKELGTEEYNKLSEDEKKAYKKMQNRRASWDNLKDTVVKKQLTPKGLAFRGVRGAGNLTSSGIKRGGEALSMVGGSAFAAAKQSISPLQIFALGWQEMGNKMKFLVGLVFALVILFVPIGVFFYAGWAVAVGFMFLISLIYWIFVNIFNGVAYVIISLINVV